MIRRFLTVFFLLFLPVLAFPARADMYPDASNATPAARGNLGIDDANRTLWSTLGVKADGVTDNTAALNELPTSTPILADCNQGGFIRFNGQWNLKSNLDIKWQTGCRMVSYLQGNGTYAISQLDDSVPLTNITLDGLTISKDAQRSPTNVERILFAWIDHLKLVNWTVTPPNSGWMFLRGSCQEIAHNSFVTGYVNVGAPGIRHIGNVPKVTDGCNQVADVWVHDNNVISGDAAYQTCQPLGTSRWTNISSDDFLWEKNSGEGSTYALIGLGNTNHAFNAFTCSNIVYVNNTGTGRDHAVLLSSQGAQLTNITYANQYFDMSESAINAGMIRIRGDDDLTQPGYFSNIVFDNVHIAHTGVYAITAKSPVGGTMSGLTFRNSIFDTPRVPFSSNGIYQPTIFIRGGNDITFQNNIIYGAYASATSTVLVGFQDAAPATLDPGTTTRFRFLNNLITNVPASNTGLYLFNVAGATIAGNTIRRTPSAASVTGVKLSSANPVGPPINLPGSTDITVNNNTLNDLATPIFWTCNGTTTSVAVFNVGDGGHICP